MLVGWGGCGVVVNKSMRSYHYQLAIYLSKNINFLIFEYKSVKTTIDLGEFPLNEQDVYWN